MMCIQRAGLGIGFTLKYLYAHLFPESYMCLLSRPIYLFHYTFLVDELLQSLQLESLVMNKKTIIYNPIV